MTVTVVTGKMGAGKNLYAVAEIERYARLGRRVVTNFRVDLLPLFGWFERFLGRKVPRVERISSRPTYDELRSLGRGGKREDVAGLLVLDECGPLFNSRSWQERDRGSVIDWLLHTRKLGWDVLIIVQNVALIDKQIRVAVIEMAVNVRRLDKLKILGMLRLPRMHVATERYGTEPNAVRSSLRVFRGNRYFRAYNTQELLSEAASGGDGRVPRVSAADDPSPVPRGVVTAPCPSPSDALSLAFFEIAQHLGVSRSVLPEGYLRERMLERAST